MERQTRRERADRCERVGNGRGLSASFQAFIDRFNALTEVDGMIREDFLKWKQGLIEQYKHEGREEGRELGEEKILADLRSKLATLLEARFGPSDKRQGRLALLDGSSLLLVSSKIHLVESEDELFEP